MTEYKIEDGIPMPKMRNKGLIPTLRKLQIGQSIFVPGRNATSVSPSFYAARPARFCSRQIEGGVRIWRIE